MDITSYSLASKANKRVTVVEDTLTTKADLLDGTINLPSSDEASKPTLGATDRGMLFNNTTNVLEQWNGTSWVNVSADIAAVSLKGTDTEANILALTGMVAEDLWIASDTLDAFAYDGANWINIGPLQGPQGDTGVSITNVTLTDTVDLVDTYTITMSDTTTSTFSITNGQNSNNWLTGTVDPTTEGLDNDLYFNSVTGDVFSKATGSWVATGNIKGIQGDVGYSIDNLFRTVGTGLAGETDTYAVYADAAKTIELGTFDVYNGQDGGGAINDSTISDSTLWSSEKINSELELAKQSTGINPVVAAIIFG